MGMDVVRRLIAVLFIAISHRSSATSEAMDSMSLSLTKGKSMLWPSPRWLLIRSCGFKFDDGATTCDGRKLRPRIRYGGLRVWCALTITR
jgi:hypothetical protein